MKQKLILTETELKNLIKSIILESEYSYKGRDDFFFNKKDTNGDSGLEEEVRLYHVTGKYVSTIGDIQGENTVLVFKDKSDKGELPTTKVAGF